MARFEYRMYTEGAGTFPALFHYDRMALHEAALRFACDYWVKEGRVYEKSSCAVEREPSCYVVYVTEAQDERTMPWGRPATLGLGGIHVELREYCEGTADYRLVETQRFHDPLEALLQLQADYVTAEGREWQRTSSEVDEDRETYVVYAVPV
ncbi:hypothetical protein [Paenibacillus sp. YYML68]|uniref:hypothetical protein n=1 Tax=Paenibacillus sp. YYML68 TaxID=2909250 RepID=UPI002493C2D5|nr:hypothetical protein [Paenibacillus sp. YYML68]